MKAREAETKFRAADRFFRQGYFHDALEILVELDQEFPSTFNILYPKAMCFERLGRRAEALELLDDLCNRFQHPRALKLRQQLQGNPTPSTFAAAVPEIEPNLFGEMIEVVPQEEPEPVDYKWPIVAVIVAVVAGLAYFLLARLGHLTPPAGILGLFEALAAAGVGAWGMFAGVCLGSAWIFLYGAMAILGHLQGDDLRGNVQDISVSALAVCGLLLIPAAGVVLALIYLYRHYDLSMSEVVLLIITGIVFAAVLVVVAIPVVVSLSLLLT